MLSQGISPKLQPDPRRTGLTGALFLPNSKKCYMRSAFNSFKEFYCAVLLVYYTVSIDSTKSPEMEPAPAGVGFFIPIFHKGLILCATAKNSQKNTLSETCCCSCSVFCSSSRAWAVFTSTVWCRTSRLREISHRSFPRPSMRAPSTPARPLQRTAPIRSTAY